jgi:putative ABC transport system ATP-binding protein
MLFKLRNLRKEWQSPDQTFQLVVPQLDIEDGDQIAILGESGCGKSTLLDILAMTLEPDSADNFSFQPRGCSPHNIQRAWQEQKRDHLAELRGRHIGYVLQTGGLLPFISVRDNIELPRQLNGLSNDGSCESLAQRLKIQDQLDKLPALLSVGQRQRVAVARALAHQPSLVLADEPTASLDPHSAGEVMDLFLELAKEQGTTLIIASHDWQRMNDLGLRQLKYQQIDEAGVLRSEFSL